LDDERFLGLRTRKLTTTASWEYQHGSQLLDNFGSVHILLDFGLRTFRFTNGLQERIKFVNRGPTVITPLLLFLSNWCWITGKSWKWNTGCSIHSKKQGPNWLKKVCWKPQAWFQWHKLL
jgi:hypothetical protein